MKNSILQSLFFLLISLQGIAQKPEVVVTAGHTDQINCISFSLNGQFLVTGGNDKNIKIWDVRTAREMRTLSGNDGRIVKVAFSPDGKCLSGLNYNGQLRTWNPVNGQLYSSLLDVEATYSNFEYCMGGKKLLYSSNSNHLVITDPFTGKIEKDYTLEISPTRFCVDLSGTKAYILDHLGNLLEFDLNSGKTLRSFPLFKEYMYCATPLVIDRTGKYLAAGFDDNHIRVFSLEKWNVLHVLKEHKIRMVDISFSRKDDRMFSVDHNRDLVIWDFKSGKKLKSIGKTVMGITSLASHPTEDILAYPEWKQVHYVDAKIGNELKLFKARGNRILSMAYDQKGKFLATAADDISIKLWNISALRIERKIDGFFPVEFSPDGEKLVCMGNQIDLRVYNPNTGEVIHRLDTEMELIQNLSFSKDGNYVAGGGFLGILKVWDIRNGKMVARLTGHAGGIYASSFHPDGSKIATCGLDNTVRIWDLKSGKEIAQMVGHEVLVNDVEYSPDGKILATASWDKTIGIWDADKHSLIKQWKGHENIVTTLNFSSDGKYLVSGAGNNVVSPIDNSIRIWDVKSGTAICKFENPTGQINKVIVEKDGNFIFSCSDDGMVKLWDINKCTEVASLICANVSDHIIVTPDHYYTASKEALQAVSFRVDDKIYPFEQFDLRLNRPDIIASRIGKTPSNLANAFRYVYEKRLKRLNYNEENFAADFHAPEISLDQSTIPLVVKEPLLKVKVKMRDQRYKLDRLHVQVNGVPMYGSTGYDLSKSSSGSIDMETEIRLISGANQISISCMNEKGAESLIEEFSVLCELSEVKRELFIVCIGVSDYNDDRFDLKYAAKDAKDVAAKIGVQSENYVKVHSKILLDKEVTRTSVLGIKEYISQAGPEDLVIVFMAGHGVLDDKFDYYFGTSDMNFDNPSGTGVSYSEIEQLFSGIPSQRKLLIMDTCHSGELDKDEVEKETKAEVEISNDVKFRSVGAGVRQKEVFGLSNTFEMMQVLFADVKNETGAVIISSSGGVEFSMESNEWKNGLFTYCLLSASSDFKADLNYDKKMSVSELRKYTYEKVIQLSNGKQKPTTRSDNLILDFVIW